MTKIITALGARPHFAQAATVSQGIKVARSDFLQLKQQLWPYGDGNAANHVVCVLAS